MWWNVTAIGCGSYQCPRLSLSGGERFDSVSFHVCYYITVYIAGVSPFVRGDPCSRCPDSHSNCDVNGLCGKSVTSTDYATH